MEAMWKASFASRQLKAGSLKDGGSQCKSKNGILEKERPELAVQGMPL